MRYLHTMLRVRNLDAALDFYCNKLGLNEMRRRVDERNKYTLVFLAAPGDAELVAKGPAGRSAPLVELTYNWNAEDYGEARYFGHLAYEVDDIYALCERMMKAGVTINRPPRDGMMAFVRSPDKHSIELLQKGAALPPKEPWRRCPIKGESGVIFGEGLGEQGLRRVLRDRVGLSGNSCENGANDTDFGTRKTRGNTSRRTAWRSPKCNLSYKSDVATRIDQAISRRRRSERQ